MNAFRIRASLAALMFSALTLRMAASDLVISEVLFNPPGPDSSFEFLEFRGVPNAILPLGTWFVAVNGDAGGNPGRIENVFDISGARFGGNGFLVLLQKDSPYFPDPRAAVLINTNGGAGWGSGSTSSLEHTGNNDITDLVNASVTFFLIHSTNGPSPGADIDANDDGIPDGDVYDGWTVLDSVGVLDGDGAGDFAYGAVNFRWNAAPGEGAGATGTVIPVGFTARYLGRLDNSSGSTALDWVASDSLGGAAPAWALGDTNNTYPGSLAGMALDHLGAANFGAPAIPGVLLAETSGGTSVVEGGAPDTYTLALNTTPSGPVTIGIAGPPGIEVSVDDGLTFESRRDLILSDVGEHVVTIRALADDVIGVTPLRRWVTNSVVATSDSANYPLTALIPEVGVFVLENDSVLFNELKVNPPGTDDSPNEFIELKGPAGVLLSNVFVLGITGDTGRDPGTVVWLTELTGCRLGGNGTLLIAATNHPYTLPAESTLLTDPLLSAPGGGLPNTTISFLLVSTATPPRVGEDLDRGDNGVLEGLPADASILDAVGWTDSDHGDVVYGGVTLRLSSATPDAATRLPWNDTPSSVTAWVCGDLAGADGATLAYSSDITSTGFPSGTLLSPGSPNNLAPIATGLGPISGVIGDPWNPVVHFVVSDDQTAAGDILVSATSDNTNVVPDTNLSVVAGASGARTLTLNPVGVGYAGITLWLSEGTQTGRVSFAYAASAPGRPGGVWHMGASDASTGIAVDDQYMIVGDDENQVLRLYERRRSGLPVDHFDMTPYLDLPDASSGLPREVDVEASTRAGNRLFWIGSLGHAASGESRTNRTRVFATDLTGTGPAARLSYVGRYDYLKLDLIAWDNQNLHGKGTNYYGFEASDAEGVPPKAPDGSGFAVEGLTMMPGSTNGAFIGFRAPIVPPTNRTFALVVPVLNFASLAASGGPPGSAVFGTPIELDLYNRGIRSIEGNTNGYLIVGGPAAGRTGPYPQDFRLYTWSGSGSDQPEQRSAGLAGLNPEGIVEVPTPPWESHTLVQILSDEGATVFYGDGIEAKFLPVPNFKKARSDWIEIGSAEKPAPLILSVDVVGNSANIRWRSLAGATYQVERCSDLRLRDWTSVPGEVIASGPYASKAAEVGGSDVFFRVALRP